MALNQEIENGVEPKDNISKMNPVDLDQLIIDLGGMGRFQKLIYLLGSLLVFLTGMGPVISVFIAYNNPHRCFVPGCDTVNSSYDEPFNNFTLPAEEESQNYKECSMYSYSSPNNTEANDCSPMYFNSNQTTTCIKWVYDADIFLTTVVADFDLVCDRAFLAPLVSSCFMGGMVIGAVLTGIICDKYGRRLGLLIGLVVSGSSGILGSLSPNYALFLFFRFVSGAGQSGIFQSMFVIVIELVGPEWRTFCGIFLELPYAVGEMSIGVLAYLIRRWRWLQVATSVPVLLLIWSYWVVPESIRWLESKNKITDAVKVVDQIAKFNKVQSPSHKLRKRVKNEDTTNKGENGDKKVQKMSVLALLRTSKMRKRALILCYCWSVCSLAYYGLSANAGNLPGNIFVSFLLTMLAEIPSYFITYILLLRIGLKRTLMFAFMTGGVACLISGLLPTDLKWSIMSLSLVGKFGIAGAFASIYVYTADLYPTEYRGVAVGTCSMCARISAIFAPIIAGLSMYSQSLPLLIFGLVTLLAGIFIMVLPETLGTELPQTVEQSEAL